MPLLSSSRRMAMTTSLSCFEPGTGMAPTLRPALPCAGSKAAETRPLRTESRDYTRLMAANQKLTRVIAGRAVSTVRHEDAVLHIDFADGSTLKVKLADPASSMMVRDKDGTLEYAD